MDGTAPAPAPSREIQISIATPSIFPGFKFSPTDEELISYYLRNKMDGFEKSVEVIPELEICRYEPWDLPEKSIIPSENEWFFFSARGRKYPNGSQSRRATELGYWKATGKERNVKSGSVVIGTKRTLVFHVGRAPKGERTEWIMHEYCIDGRSQDAPVICRLKRNTEFRLNGGSNRSAASVSLRQIMENSNHGVSGVGGEGMRFSGGEKVGDQSMARKASSSYDSHSVEQLDSASESNLKVAHGAAHAESSSRHKDSDEDYVEGEDDFYADILKDEIIKLDESSTSATPNVLKMEKSWLRSTEGESPQFMHGALAPPTPVVFKDRGGQPPQPQPQEVLLGFGNDNNNNNNNNDLYNNADKDKNQEWRMWWFPSSPSCLLTTVFAGKTVKRQVSAIIAVVALVGAAVFLLGGFDNCYYI